MIVTVTQQELEKFGKQIGAVVHGGEVIELVGDVGAGKTTLTKAIAEGMGIAGPIHSPTFTISNQYETGDGVTLIHYDFYRLQDPGIMQDELAETVGEYKAVVVIEWGAVVRGVLPEDRLQITISITSETKRELTFHAGGTASKELLKELA